MFQFEDSSYLYLAGLGIGLALLFFFNRRSQRKKLAKLGQFKQLYQQINLQSKLTKRIRQSLLIIAFIALSIALANPQLGAKKETVKREAIDLIIALDISNSMMAEDLSPNRLSRAKKLGIDLVNKLKGNRIGLILFAGNAYVQMPLTTDYGAFNTFLNAAKPELASTQGTEFAPLLQLADQTFIKESQTTKVLLIITDGESHDEAGLQAADQFANTDFKIYTVGIGTEEGAYVPYAVNGRTDFKRDEEGNFVISKINLNYLAELSNRGGGQLFPYTGDKGLAQVIADKLNSLEKMEMEQRIYTDYYSYFQYFLALAILLFSIEFILRNRKSKLENHQEHETY